MMHVSRKTTVLFLCVVGLPAWAQTTQPAKRTLNFEKGAPWIGAESRSSDGIPRDHRSLCFTQGTPWDAQRSPYLWIPNAPTFVSSFAVPRNRGAAALVQPEYYVGQLDEDKPYVLAGALAINAEIEKRAEQFGLSPEQRRLLKDSKAVILMYVSEGERGFCCLAVSEEDARHMAEALLEYLDSSWQAEYQRLRTQLEAHEKTIAEGPGQVAQAKKDLESTEKTIAALEKVVLVTQDRELELQKMLRSIQIDIAGIQAKLDAIKKLRGSAKDALVAHLDQMQATQDIELAGAMVRKGMVETDLKNATEYSEARAKHAQLKTYILNREMEIESARKALSECRGAVEAAKRQLEPIQVTGPVTVSPLVKPVPQTRPAKPTR